MEPSIQTTQDLRATSAGDLAGVIKCRNAGVPIDCHDEVSETIRTQITLSTTTCGAHNVHSKLASSRPIPIPAFLLKSNSIKSLAAYWP